MLLSDRHQENLRSVSAAFLLAPVQTTLQSAAHFAGRGLFTGEKCSVRLVPSGENTGIVFQRVDLPGRPEIPARLEFVKEAPRCTRLMRGSVSIQMVEHLLSALHGMGVDNLRIEVEGPEIPAGDGSALPFVQMIEEAGLHPLSKPKRTFRVEEPTYWSEGEVHLIALPYPGFRLSFTLHYPQSSLIGSQYYSACITPENYKSELASSRTFCLYEEIAPLIERGLLKGGLENGLVIRDDKILNVGGARFPDEMVRHKVLDLVGDLALLGVHLEGHIIAIRSGHSSNVAFAKALKMKWGR